MVLLRCKADGLGGETTRRGLSLGHVMEQYVQDGGFDGGFALRAVYGTLTTPAMASKWN